MFISLNNISVSWCHLCENKIVIKLKKKKKIKRVGHIGRIKNVRHVPDVNPTFSLVLRVYDLGFANVCVTNFVYILFYFIFPMAPKLNSRICHLEHFFSVSLACIQLFFFFYIKKLDKKKWFHSVFFLFLRAERISCRKELFLFCSFLFLVALDVLK